MTFVSAVRILAAPSIALDDLDIAHKKLLTFGATTSSLYNRNKVTPNMHLHGHLKQCILDFGPVYAFWLYSFERFNGVMKNININHKTGFETTYMNAFVQAVHAQDYLRSFSFLSSASPASLLFSSLLSTWMGSNSQQVDSFSYSRFLQGPILGDTTSVKGCEPLPPSSLPLDLPETKIVMNLEHYRHLCDYYKHVYSPEIPNIMDVYTLASPPVLSVRVNNVITKFATITILGETYRSLNRRTDRGSYVCAHLKHLLFAGRILYFFVHRFNNQDHVFAFVQWFDRPTANVEADLNTLLPFKKTYAALDSTCILPVQRMLGTIAVSDFLSDHVRVNVLPRKMHGE